METESKAKIGAAALKQLLAPVRIHLLIGRLLALLSAICAVFPYVALVGVGNELVGAWQRSDAPQSSNVHYWIMVLIGTYCIRLSLYFVALAITHVADTRLTTTIQRRIMQRLGRTELEWFSENTSGHVRKALQDDLHSLHMNVAHRPVDVTVSIVLPLLCSIYSFIIDGRLGLLVITSLPIYALIYSFFMRGVGDKTAELDAKTDAVSAAMVEFIKGIQVVKTFGIVGQAHRRYAQRAAQACDYMEQWNRPMITAASLTAALVSPAVLVAYVGGIGSLLVGNGTITPTELITGVLIAIGLPETINLVATVAWGYQMAGAAARRITQLLDTPTLDDTPATPDLDTDAAAQSTTQGTTQGVAQVAAPPGLVEISDVTVKYGDAVALESVSLTCQPGTVTALMGPSGAGKTTLARLVARFVSPESGTVYVGGRDVRQIDAAQLYSRVGFVLQDAHLIRASIWDNLTMGRPDATRAEVETVARSAQIHDEIVAMARGYDTVVGEEQKLSGGQAQRIAIARTLLVDAPILILDEAAAMVDPESEAQIQKAINALTKGRTVIVIDHRPDSIRHADQIVILERGQIVARGSHEEIANNELYRRLRRAASSKGENTQEEGENQ